MKILLATSTVTYNAGIPSFNRELATLIGADNELHLLVDEDIISYPGYMKVFSTANINIFNYKDVLNLLDVLLLEDYDVVVNSNSHLISLLAPFLDNRTRLITVSHSMGTMDCDNAIFNKNYIDNIIALSSSCKEYICNRFGRDLESKISVIFNSVKGNPRADQLRNTKKHNDTIKIVFAGGAAPSKSPDIIVPVIHELCKTSMKFEFYWLGIKTPPMKRFQVYNDISDILPNDPRVIVTGLIPQKEAANIISACNIFIAPSRREGFPMALLEAMSVGCIPIVSDYKIANKEIIDDAVNGYVIHHKDINAFVQRISHIVMNHCDYHNIYDNSYQDFIAKLSFPIWRNKMLQVFQMSALEHKERLVISKLTFLITVLRFKVLENYNLIENHIKEVLPCAVKFLKYYIQYGHRKR